jgi:hypothetical protein
MSIDSERKDLLRRVKKDGRRNYKALAKKIRVPYTTFMLLVKESSYGTIRTWLKIERYYQKTDHAEAEKVKMAVNQ